jgi:formylmethanofuran dehydrogenase subunit B
MTTKITVFSVFWGVNPMYSDIITRHLNRGTVEPEVSAIARQQLNKHVSVTVDTQATTEELL